MRTSSERDARIALRCEGLGKRYRIGERAHYQTLRDSLSSALAWPSRILSKSRIAPESPSVLWALRDFAMEVHRGEVVGIIGRNGSGKSTLLKLLSRITRPTEGTAEIRGRLGTLLEVGAGFHPELTGRENIYLNGAILGMSRTEIDHKFDEIVDFSECSRMLDTVMKHYSSGMYVRLAFAVAAHLETEILLVDEVLAVGDAMFQKKCLGKINDVAHAGRTVLFVSHNMLAIDGLCTRAICLHDGKAILDGPPRVVTSEYLKNWLPQYADVVFGDFATAPGHEMIRLHRASVRPQHAEDRDRITVRTPILVEFEYWSAVEHAPLNLVAQVSNEHGIDVFTTANFNAPELPKGLTRSSFLIPGDLMNNGTYRVTLIALLGMQSYVTEWNDVVTFEVYDSASELRGAYHDELPGAVRPHLEWQTEWMSKLPPRQG
ncbi:MAG: ABC transporter ATP-binding protein [Terracidiphilus sp.]|nr:ABC transporter ATP-binding protein [Terracidiphilus sp.]